jgi:hypothetical protein
MLHFKVLLRAVADTLSDGVIVEARLLAGKVIKVDVFLLLIAIYRYKCIRI